MPKKLEIRVYWRGRGDPVITSVRRYYYVVRVRVRGTAWFTPWARNCLGLAPGAQVVTCGGDTPPSDPPARQLSSVAAYLGAACIRTFPILQ